MDIARKSLVPVQLKALADDEFEAWAKGAEPWRLLALPFGGPVPSPIWPRGVDLDGQTFTENTDIYGEFDALRTSRERFIDFHHSGSARNRSRPDYDVVMGGAVLAKGILDDEPDEYGWWVDMWANRQERRLDLIRRLRDRGLQLFGSAEPVRAGRAKANGEITYFPWLFVTLSPTPQNTNAVVRPKAALDEVEAGHLSAGDAMRAFLSELDAQGADLPATLALPGSPLAASGEAAAKAERVLITPEVRQAWDDLTGRAKEAARRTSGTTEGDT